MDQKSGQENMAVEERWPLWGGGRCGEVAVSGGSTVCTNLLLAPK